MRKLIHTPFTFIALLLMVAGLTMAGCSSLSNTEKGAAAGAGAGAVVGGAIGKAAGSTAKGAIIGAVVGGTAGAIIGQQMDKQAEELENEIPEADVERVGEGIQVTFDSGILFDFDSSALRPEAKSNLRELANSLQEYDNTDVTIVGHTDSRGSDEYNYALSERRASSAASYLMSLGVARNRITTFGK
ncbi:MAG TPA: OmpA family protein, partial [Rhodothermales bacterium]|nr:OmpA family protein [Rhodothermales bacterium]